MIHVVHHPDYVLTEATRSAYPWGKNRAIRDLLLAEGEGVVAGSDHPEDFDQYGAPTSRSFRAKSRNAGGREALLDFARSERRGFGADGGRIEGIAWHAPEAMPREKERRIGFPVTQAVARRAAIVHYEPLIQQVFGGPLTMNIEAQSGRLRSIRLAPTMNKAVTFLCGSTKR